MIIKQLSVPKLKGILKEWVPSIVSSIAKQLKMVNKIKNVNLVVSIFNILKDICSTDKNLLESHLSQLVPLFKEFIVDKKHISTQQESLQLSLMIFNTHSNQFLSKYVEDFTSSALLALKSQNIQVISSSISLLGNISKILTENDFSSVEKILNGILPFYEATDVDQAIKENSISSVSQIIYHFGNKISNLDNLVSILIERIKNEVTRLSSIQALETITKSPQGK